MEKKIKALKAELKKKGLAKERKEAVNSALTRLNGQLVEKVQKMRKHYKIKLEVPKGVKTTDLTPVDSFDQL
jgi:hypothetical protein